MSTAIEFNNISKQYRLGLVSTKTLSHDLYRWWTMNVLKREDPYLKVGETNDRSTKGDSDYVWALKNIDFKVEQGDVVGIIGKNGAGKSTLLKLLSRVTTPTTGTIRAKGRIASLLEVGTGFHQEMTGRENIYMNGAILGMTKKEIDRKFDEIVDFSGCERYIDTPVKRYSSGMMVRLGFAVAAHLDPEILVVDEVLAVGDAEFQKKAIGKMNDISKGDGRTVLFVSHNMESVRNLCRSGVVLKNGYVDYIGDVNDAVDYYLANSGAGLNTKYVLPVAKDVNLNKVYFQSIELENDKVTTSSPISFLIKMQANDSLRDVRVNCTVKGMDDVPIGGISSECFFDVEKGMSQTIRYTIKNHNLVKGNYKISFSVGKGNYATGQTDFDIVQDAVDFTIEKYSDGELDYFAQWHPSWGRVLFHNDVELIG